MVLKLPAHKILFNVQNLDLRCALWSIPRLVAYFKSALQTHVKPPMVMDVLLVLTQKSRPTTMESVMRVEEAPLQSLNLHPVLRCHPL